MDIVKTNQEIKITLLGNNKLINLERRFVEENK